MMLTNSGQSQVIAMPRGNNFVIGSTRCIAPEESPTHLAANDWIAQVREQWADEDAG
jgi:hypothetical protein